MHYITIAETKKNAIAATNEKPPQENRLAVWSAKRGSWKSYEYRSLGSHSHLVFLSPAAGKSTSRQHAHPWAGTAASAQPGRPETCNARQRDSVAIAFSSRRSYVMTDSHTDPILPIFSPMKKSFRRSGLINTYRGSKEPTAC
jgi:hypothetical protein